MTGTSQATDIARPFESGAKVQHKLTARTGIVLTRTIENPPRYVVLFKGDQSEGLALHHEIEGAQAEQRQTFAPNPFRDSFTKFLLNTFTTLPIKPTEAKPAEAAASSVNGVEWEHRPDQGAGRQISKCGRFSVGHVMSGWTGYDYRYGKESEPMETRSQARKWCEERAPLLSEPRAVVWSAPAPSGAMVSKCGRWMVEHTRGGYYRGRDIATGTNSAEPITREQARAWCEHRASGKPDDAKAAPLEWFTPNMQGETQTRCYRFAVVCENYVGNAYRAHDLYAKRKSIAILTQNSAKAWCEKANRGEDPEAAEAEEKTVTGLDGQIVGPIEAPGALKWLPVVNRWMRDTSERFKISDHGNHLHVPFDNFATARGVDRMGPAGSLAEAKAWCEKRNTFNVVTETNGEQRLIPKSEIPF